MKRALANAKVAVVGASRWAAVSYSLVRDEGWAGIRESARTFRTGLWRLAGLVYNYGVPVYERDWDVLVVLDACRADLMAEVAPAYDLPFDTVTSVASASPEWMDKNFRARYAEQLRETAYVTANPYSQDHADDGDFTLLDEVWRDAWDDDLGTVTADVVTDRAIHAHRTVEPARMIVHYMQPHHPFVPTPLDAGMDREAGPGSFEQEASVWRDLRLGLLSHDEVWAAYRENLEYALDHVSTLLESIDAETVVITSDHGNAFGEYGLYGHPIYAPVAALKTIPWCVTGATDSGEYDPTHTGEAPGTGADGSGPTDGDTDIDASVERKLADLGYL